MLLMQHHQDGLSRRLSVIGIPRQTIKPFIGLMVKWESCSGVEWTIKRLKGLKVDLIRRRTGLPSLSWVRKNSKGEIAGTIGTLFRWSDRSPVNFKRCVQAFMAYTYYILPALTEAQKEKFLKAINPEKGDGLTDSFHREFARTVRRTIRRRSLVCDQRPLVIYQGSPGKKAPRSFGQRSVPQDKRILDELQYFVSPSGIGTYVQFHRLYKPLVFGLGSTQVYLETIWKQHLLRPMDPFEYIPQGGEIHFLQEPGGKLRSVASPFRLHQEALRPLGSMLYGVVKSLPWDCTFDQSKGIPFIQSCLARGGQVHSIDLSSATDHFPLSLQETALRSIIRKDSWDHIDLFVKISRGIWKSPIGWLKWTKGQPLGLYPSFASFTLTHGLLLLHLAGGEYHHQFFVVGDDVVILEQKLRDDYIAMLDRMSCPWSEDKSLSSNKLAEFAGKIITQAEVVPQLKWRGLSSDNFLDICRLLGRKSRCLLNERQKAVFDMVAHLCEPIGLNMSLPGDNLEKMVKRTLDFYQPAEVILGTLMGLRRKINHLVYSSTNSSFNSDELKELLDTFDEKVKEVMSQTVYSNWKVAVSIGIDSFESLPEALDLKPRLPLKGYQPSRLTTLDRYERLLSQKGLS